jgi:hypothetical protein
MNKNPGKSSGPDAPASMDDGFLSSKVTGCHLLQNHPALFAALTTEYRGIVQRAAEKASSYPDREILSQIAGLSRRAGEHDAAPVDLVAIHLAALGRLATQNSRPVAKACLRQARLLFLKMIGELALYYRSKVPIAKAAAQ